MSTLFVSILVAAAAAGVYFLVGHRLLQRGTEPQLRLARNTFAAWWFLLAGSTLLTATQHAAALIGVRDMAVYGTILHLNLFLIAFALWALLHHLIFLYTGSNKHLLPLSAFYVAYFVLLLYYVEQSVPTGIEVSRWSSRITYERELEGPFFVVVLILLVVPQILAALAYGSLYFRVRDKTMRYRIVLVSGSLFVWFTSALIASATGFAQTDVYQATSRLLGFGAALTILLAYQPPRFIQRRLGVVPLRSEDRLNTGA